MCSKSCFKISCNNKQEKDNSDKNEVYMKNDALLSVITKYKNKITPYYQNKTWDKYKKVSNEYELIFTTPYAKNNISLYNPISRSFFKMWEILHDFKDDIIISSANTKINALFLAEGPGGFLEALMKFRNNTNDMYYGMTLKPEHKSIPEWKLNKFENNTQIITLYGADDRGDLYNLDNTAYLVDYLGLNSMDIITADGGFDFSSNFNEQEDLSSKLIKCEIYCAFHLLREGGTFILKIFDMFHKDTLVLVQILYESFQYIYITKPNTSRPANSEKYLVCCNYKVSNGNSKISTIKKYINNKDQEQYMDIDYNLLQSIIIYNAYYTSRQIYYIQKTLDYIAEFEKLSNIEKFQKQDKIIERNKEKCREWCSKYHIDFVGGKSLMLS